MCECEIIWKRYGALQRPQARSAASVRAYFSRDPSYLSMSQLVLIREMKAIQACRN